jgi:hypothetical protein
MILGIALIVAMTASACAQQNNPESEFRAEPVDGGKSVRITEYVGEKWTVRIPPRIRGLPVTHIGEEAFYKKNLTSVTIPDSVRVIEYRAFDGNQLTSVTIPNSVTYLSGFNGNQLTSITIPNSVTSIGDEAFADNKLTSVTIPDSVTVIEYRAFGGNQLTSVTIPNSVTEIYDRAFSYNQLTSVTIPSSVTYIYDHTFSYNQLTSVIIPSSVTHISSHAFFDNKLISITIGANLFSNGAFHYQNDDYPYIHSIGFEESYSRAGRNAGTYTRSNTDSTTWTKQ